MTRGNPSDLGLAEDNEDTIFTAIQLGLGVASHANWYPYLTLDRAFNKNSSLGAWKVD